MPYLTQTVLNSDPVKMLLPGDSGSGKTGALASLAKAGYNLRILDFDNGIDILAAVLADDPEAQKRVVYETLTDQLKGVAGRPRPKGQPKAFERGLALLSEWKTDEYNLGYPGDWGQDTIIVVDSLDFMGKAALRKVIHDNLGVAKGATSALDSVGQPQWGIAMRWLEDVLALLYCDEIKCHVIVTSHITFVGGDEEGKGAKGYPAALGSKLPPIVGRYFNRILVAKSVGTRRVILTQPDGVVETKSPPLVGIPRELPQLDGLATYFKAATNLTVKPTNQK